MIKKFTLLGGGGDEKEKLQKLKEENLEAY